MNPVTPCVQQSLYHIGFDPYLRNQPRLPDAIDPTLFIRPPLPLHLRYIFVPAADDEEGNQLILGRVLQYIYDFPTFRPAPGSPLATNRGGVPETIRVRPDLIGFEPLAQLWSTLARPYRLSASFLVDTVAVDRALPAQVTTRVGQTVTATKRKTAGGHTMTVVEHIAGPQILLRGQVSDSLTGLGIAASLVLDFAQGAGFKPLPFPLRHQSGGLFAVAARLSDIAGRMQSGKAVTLRLTASAPGYQSATPTQALTAAQFARKAGSIMVGAWRCRWKAWRPPRSS